MFLGAAAKSLQSCSTLCDPLDGSPPGSPVPGILQARTLEWGAIAFCDIGKLGKFIKSRQGDWSLPRGLEQAAGLLALGSPTLLCCMSGPHFHLCQRG